ncbi:probable 39S ribosomal protein L23, mitochondrial [Mya arenaria]|uniref:probable 39S ribosomal protein L23, mitochondrial n=1 Tax=Mya arenaria TaxID=6604 RepID=UPI0022E734BB|nr:probable 39S ribosomal protein L23, mitochondrial [Mya arenaria]
MTKLGFLERLPLWKRTIPRYPLYYRGDPQPRVFLPLFWMKMVKPTKKVPPNVVHFKVHPQMTRPEIKQYLEKIYDTSVSTVRTELREVAYMGAVFKDQDKQSMVRKNVIARDFEKYAYVTLAKDTFTYPEVPKSKVAEDKEVAEKLIERKKTNYEKMNESLGVPAWFRR